MSSRSGDDLLQMLLAGEDIPGEEGRAANDLLLEVLRGYPVQNLSRLIHSDSDTAVANGAFVVSELGAQAAQIIDEVDFLLGHPLRDARFDALDAALTAASAEHGGNPRQSSHAGRRSRPGSALESAPVPRELHARSAHCGRSLSQGSPRRQPRDVACLCRKRPGQPARHPHPVAGSDKATRMFAAAAAARVDATSRQGLEDAVGLDDPDIASFAADAIDMLDFRQQLRAEREQRRRERG